MTSPLTLLSALTVWSLVSTPADGGSPGELQDYCERESFTAACQPHEVIMIRLARYGRIRKSRCITDNYPIDCSTSARQYLDERCSGQRTCSTSVVSLVPVARQPCDSDLRSYMEAAYDCIPVAHADPKYCQGGGSQLQLTAPVGYLSTLEANQTGCGTVDTPWLIVAKSGQAIKVTLLDFSSGADSWRPETCKVIAVIRDVHMVGSTETVCSSGAREEDVFTSISNMVEVRLVGPGKTDGTKARYPLIRYEMLGCADLPAPPGGWMKRVDSIVTMGCNGSDSMWTQKCDGTSWVLVGQRQNCTTGVAAIGSGGGMWTLLSNSHTMSIVTILVIALIVGVIILIIGLLYLRRCRHVHQESPHIPSHPEEDYHITLCKEQQAAGERRSKQPDQDSLQTYQSTTGNDYYRTWQLQRHLSNQAAGGSTSLPPPPYCEQTAGRRNGSSQNKGSPYAEHIYESPKFDRRDAPYSGGMDGDTPTEYYELDPESVHIPDFNARGK